jgi:hypothetical protein
MFIRLRCCIVLLIKYFIICTCECRTGTITFQLKKDGDGMKTGIEIEFLCDQREIGCSSWNYCLLTGKSWTVGCFVFGRGWSWRSWRTDVRTGRGKVARGGCLLAWNFAVTRPIVFTVAERRHRRNLLVAALVTRFYLYFENSTGHKPSTAPPKWVKNSVFGVREV